jgi:exodeoxyribonuclease-3
VKIATWNINSIKSRLEHLLKWCDSAQPDVLCLQETKVTDDKFPERRLRTIGFEHMAFYGERA